MNQQQTNQRNNIVHTAARSIGPGDQYARQFPGVAWCGLWALHILHQVGLAKQIPWEIGRGFLYRLPRTSDPQPGDMLYIDRPLQHHAIIEHVTPTHITSIDGNQAGNTVQRRTRARDSSLAFYSVAPLLSDTAPEHPLQSSAQQRSSGSAVWFPIFLLVTLAAIALVRR